VDLAQIALTAEGLDPEPRSDDLRGLDGPRDDAGKQDIGPYAARHRKVVPQRSGLRPAAVGQAYTTARSRDDPVEAGMCISVANEYKTHHPFTVRAQGRDLCRSGLRA
jgi:hypothetical protein